MINELNTKDYITKVEDCIKETNCKELKKDPTIKRKTEELSMVPGLSK